MKIADPASINPWNVKIDDINSVKVTNNKYFHWIVPLLIADRFNNIVADIPMHDGNRISIVDGSAPPFIDIISTNIGEIEPEKINILNRQSVKQSTISSLVTGVFSFSLKQENIFNTTFSTLYMKIFFLNGEARQKVSLKDAHDSQEGIPVPLSCYVRTVRTEQNYLRR